MTLNLGREALARSARRGRMASALVLTAVWLGGAAACAPVVDPFGKPCADDTECSRDMLCVDVAGDVAVHVPDAGPEESRPTIEPTSRVCVPEVEASTPNDRPGNEPAE